MLRFWNINGNVMNKNGLIPVQVLEENIIW